MLNSNSSEDGKALFERGGKQFVATEVVCCNVETEKYERQADQDAFV
jgi:hypothetical protein